MNCKNCGAVLSDTASFCDQCGRSTGNINDDVNITENGDYKNNSNNGKNNSALGIVIAIIAIIFIVGAIIGAFALYDHLKDDSDKNDSDKSSTSANKEDESDDEGDSDKNEENDDEKDSDKDKESDDEKNSDKDEESDDEKDSNKDKESDDKKDSDKDEENDDKKDSDKDKETENEKDSDKENNNKTEQTTTSADSSYIVTYDDVKVNFKIPSTLQEDKEFSSETNRCIEKKNDKSYRFVAWISEDYGSMDEYMEDVAGLIEYKKENSSYNNIELSDVKTLTVEGKTFTYRTLHYNYSTTPFKELYIAYEIAEDSLYTVEIDSYDLLTDDELKALLTISIEK